MERRTCTVMLPLVSCFRLLQMWPFLLLASVVPPHSAWSLRPRGLLATRPLCSHRNPSAPRSVCLWGKTPPPERGSRAPSLRQRSPIPKGAERRGAARLRRQAQGSRPATPSGLEDGLSSSQYPWAIVWGPTISVEDGGDPNSANPGLPPLGYTFLSSGGMATAQPNSHSLLQNEGLNLRQTPATLRPFLFGPPGEGNTLFVSLRSFVSAAGHSAWWISDAGKSLSAALAEAPGLILSPPEMVRSSQGQFCGQATQCGGHLRVKFALRGGPSAVRHRYDLCHYCPSCHGDNTQILLGPEPEAPPPLQSAEWTAATGQPAATDGSVARRGQRPGVLRGLTDSPAGDDRDRAGPGGPGQARGDREDQCLPAQQDPTGEPVAALEAAGRNPLQADQPPSLRVTPENWWPCLWPPPPSSCERGTAAPDAAEAL